MSTSGAGDGDVRDVESARGRGVDGQIKAAVSVMKLPRRQRILEPPELIKGAHMEPAALGAQLIGIAGGQRLAADRWLAAAAAAGEGPQSQKQPPASECVALTWRPASTASRMGSMKLLSELHTAPSL